MATGRVEIHDPLNSHHGTDHTDQSTHTEGMVEFRILMAYAQRRRPKDLTKPLDQDNNNTQNGFKIIGGSIKSEDITAEKKKKKKIKFWKRLSKALTCFTPQTKDELPSRQGADSAPFRNDVHHEEDVEDVASRLAEISAEISFVLPETDIETDSEDDEVEKVIGLLLRDAGDRLYERELKDTNIAALLGNYTFFERVILSLLVRMGLSKNSEKVDPEESAKSQIAVACEATTRLSVLDTLPMTRLMSHGATFLNMHFSSWAEQHGGYEKAFDSEEEDDEVH
ncbi:unnamed protein product [Knipowitschia caucasica]|uniref:Apoptosis facilitator Bcl-2-like protein 14 n=1 Tax=Knipowitschia caucasica TaxID=637954 RepID=A0AAV2IT54_KNICA